MLKRMVGILDCTDYVAGCKLRTVEPCADCSCVAHTFLAAVVGVEQTMALRLVGMEAALNQIAVGTVAEHAVVAGIAHRRERASHECDVAAHVVVVELGIVRLIGNVVVVDVRPCVHTHVLCIDEPVAHLIVRTAVQHQRIVGGIAFRCRVAVDGYEVIDVVCLHILANRGQIHYLRHSVDFRVVIDTVLRAREHHFCRTVVHKVVVELQAFAQVGVGLVETRGVALLMVDCLQVAVVWPPAAMSRVDVDAGFVERDCRRNGCRKAQCRDR